MLLLMMMIIMLWVIMMVMIMMTMTMVKMMINITITMFKRLAFLNWKLFPENMLSLFYFVSALTVRFLTRRFIWDYDSTLGKFIMFDTSVS